MCGRYIVIQDEEYYDELRSIVSDMPNRQSKATAAQGEIFPTNSIPVIYQHNGRNVLSAAKWGFPGFGTNQVIINARAETVTEKPMFRNAFMTKRCLIPANGYYEWLTNEDKKKVKYLITVEGHALFFMAGLYNLFTEKPHISGISTPGTSGSGTSGSGTSGSGTLGSGTSGSGSPISGISTSGTSGSGSHISGSGTSGSGSLISGISTSGTSGSGSLISGTSNTQPARYAAVTIITTEAAGSIRFIHNRMPVILPQNKISTWLDGANIDIQALQSVLIPFSAGIISYKAI